MKLIFLAVLTTFMLSIQAFSQPKYCISMVQAPSSLGQFAVKVRMNTDISAFTIGVSNLGFSFNSSALTYASGIFVGTAYGNLASITNPVTGIISVNINQSTAVSIGTTPVEVATIVFNITNIAATSQMAMNVGESFIFDIGNAQIDPVGSGCPTLDIPLSTVLPIELQSFTCEKKNGKSLLNWKVASEKNLNFYQLERSNDGVIFSNIYEIKSKAYAINEKVSYDYTDEKPLSGINYYRLKAVDRNSEFKYSKVVSLDFGKILRGSAYPNPFSTDISIEMDINKNAGEIFVEIFDMVGKQIYFKKIAAETERMTIPIPTTDLPDGTYVIRVKNGANIWQHKIVKN
jgi:Secretion system C-terminal sorting domain